MLRALGFLSVIALPGAAKRPNRASLFWFPIAGIIIGLTVAGTYSAAHMFWPPLVAAAVVLTFDIAITGALHYDGLADSADALMPHMGREKRLEVLSEPTIGVFGIVAVAIAVVMRLAVFSQTNLEAVSIAIIWVMSRSIAAAILIWIPYARSTGLASGFLGNGQNLAALRVWLAAVVIAAVIALAYISSLSGLLAGLALLFTSAATVGVARKRIGGFTGDVIGAAIVLGETAALLLLSAQISAAFSASYF